MIKLMPVNVNKKVDGKCFKDEYLETVKKVIVSSFELILKQRYNKLKKDKYHIKKYKKVNCSRQFSKTYQYKQLEKINCIINYNKLESTILCIVNHYMTDSSILNIEEFFLLNNSDINILYKNIKRDKNKYNEEINKNKYGFEALLVSYSKLRESTRDKKKFSYKLVEAMGIVVCPYCNRNYINVGSEDGRYYIGAQLDHFIPKKEYPIFAVCINNFVPSCGKCNQYKGEEVFSCSPYDHSKSINRPRVCIDPVQPEGFRIDPGDFKDQFDILKLGAAYKIHKQDYKELEKRARIYNESQIEEIEELLGLKYQGISYDDFIFGTQYLESEDHKHPLSKFNRDIVNELKEIMSRSR